MAVWMEEPGGVGSNLRGGGLVATRRVQQLRCDLVPVPERLEGAGYYWLEYEDLAKERLRKINHLSQGYEMVHWLGGKGIKWHCG